MANSNSECSIQYRVLIAISVFMAGGAGMAEWLVIGPQRESTAIAAAANVRIDPSNGSVTDPKHEQKAASAVPPDPRFVRRLPLSLPGALSPEARQMALVIQQKYRCAHCCGEQSTPQCLPGLGGDASLDAPSLIAALRKSLGTLPDDCYVSTALPKVVDPKTPAELMNILYEDLLKRPNPIKLRMLFIIAEIDGHPLAADALANLRSTTNLDHQQDWQRWEQAVVQQCAHEERGMRSDNCRIH